MKMEDEKECIDKQRECFLLKILHEVLGDTSVLMDKDYEYSCSVIFKIDNDANWGVEIGYDNPEMKALHREIYGVDSILEHYWKPKTLSALIRWYPGGCSSDGFLGWGEKLNKVIDYDIKILSSLGKTSKKLGLKVKEILDKVVCVKKITEDVVIVENFEVHFQDYLGYQTCPFENCKWSDTMCSHSASDFQIKNMKTGGSINIPGMIWHLIGEHNFFEGKKSSYRVDPEQLIKVLYDLE